MRRPQARAAGLAAAALSFLAVGLLPTGLPPAGMLAVASVGVTSFGAANATTGTTLSASPSVSTATGDLLVATIKDRSASGVATVGSVTDSAGNSWVRATSVTAGSSDDEIWYVANATAISTLQTVTVTITGAASLAFSVLDVSGSSTGLDKTATSTGNSTTPTTGTTASTTSANEFVAADIGWNSNPTLSGQSAGYTHTATEQSTVSGLMTGEQAAYQVVSSSGPQSYSGTLSSAFAWAGAIATFKLGNPTPPAITSLSVNDAVMGALVTINGSGFSGTTAVDFNGTPAKFTASGDTQINTSVPCGATTGPIHVTNGSVSASSSTFTVDPSPQPGITSFSPPSGPVGTSVLISGSGLICASAVNFGSTSQPAFVASSDSMVTAAVPVGASTDVIHVTTPGGTADSPTRFTVTQATAAPHVMVIVEENHSYKWTSTTGNQGIIGNPNAPYINSLATTYLSATKGYAIVHGSPPDYQATIAGNTSGNFNAPANLPTIATELDTAGISWKAYEESMPSSCYKSNYPAGSTASTALYSVDHNPFLYYVISSVECQANVVSYAQFQTDLSNNALPAFSYVVPNNCNDMHTDCTNGVPDGACVPSPCTKKDQFVQQGDTWLKNNLPPILASSWYKQGGIVIITWDEAYTSDTSGWANGAACSSCGGGNIPTIVVSAANSQLSNHSYTTGFNLYGILRGIEETYAVGLLGNTSSTGNGDLEPAFGPATTGSIKGTVTDSATSAPVAGATVSYTGGSATTAADGSYTLSLVAPGNYTVTASASGYNSLGATGVVVTAGATTTQNFALVPQAGSISGTVTDGTTKNPIQGATVSDGSSSANTDVNGNYTFSGLVEGTYTVTASATGYSSQSASVTVGPGVAATQNFALPAPPGSITGKVTDAQTSSPISGATVSGGGATATTDGTGTYTLSNVLPGTYTVTAAMTGYVTGSASSVTVTTGNSTPQDFSLTETGTIAGTVIDTGTNNPISGATVSCACGSTSTDGSGKYTLSNIDPSTSPTVSVSAPGYASQTSSPVSVSPGATSTQNFALVATRQVVFSDGFESGNFSAWTSSTGMTVETATVHSGVDAAQGNASSTTANANKALASTYGTAYMSVWFDIVSQGSRIYVLSARTTTGNNVSSVFVSTGHQIGILNGGETTSHLSTLANGKVAAGWNKLELYVVVNGASSSTKVWLNGVEVTELTSSTANLGTTQVGMLQIGTPVAETWNVVFDDAAFDTQYIP